MCKFNEAWIGTCKKDDEPFCPEHSSLKCCSCAEQATRTCDSTGQFVCGAPLCDECEHTIVRDGTNGGVGFVNQSPPEGMKSHCKKADQKYTPWYARDDEPTAVKDI